MELAASFKNYLYSDYKIDDDDQGYLSFDSKAMWGRAVSLIDTTSQAGKAVYDVAGSLVISTYEILKVTAVIPALFNAIASIAFEGRREVAKEYAFTALNGLSKGVVTATLGTLGSLIYRIIMIAADCIGILLPEVGRMARNFSKIMHEGLALLNKNDSEKIDYVGQPDIPEDDGKHNDSDRLSDEFTFQDTGHKYNYTRNSRPVSSSIGKFTVEQAKQLLGLTKKGELTLKKVEKAARRLFRVYHPDKNLDKDAAKMHEEFNRISNAKEFLIQECHLQSNSRRATMIGASSANFHEA